MLVAGLTVATPGAAQSVPPPVPPPAPAAVEDATFTPGEARLDTAGKVIQAHGGQIVPSVDEAGDTIYHWYGEDRSNGYASSPGVHVYSSHDLETWTDEGLALRAMSSPDQFDADPYFAGLYGDLDADARVFGYRLGQVPGMPASFHADESLMEAAVAYDTSVPSDTSAGSGEPSAGALLEPPQPARARASVVTPAASAARRWFLVMPLLRVRSWDRSHGNVPRTVGCVRRRCQELRGSSVWLTPAGDLPR